MNRFRRWMVRFLFFMLVAVPGALLAVYFLNPFGVRSLDPRQRIVGHGLYRVPSASMLPGIAPGQTLVTRAGFYVKRPPERGDVVTFMVPQDHGNVWLQRVIGLPGEKVSIESGRVLVNGRALQEPYVAPENAQDEYSQSMPATTVPEGSYFMLGDNRDNSLDSRMQPTTRREDITGKVVGRF